MIIGFENIPIYGIFVILSLLINCIMVFVLGKKLELKRNDIICSLTFEMILAILGAKVLNMIQEHNSFFYAGLSSYGGAIGGIIAVFAFSKMYKIPILKLLNVYVPLLPLIYGIAKFGCFFSGCCYGIEYNGFGSISYKFSTEAPLNIGLFPVQLLEAILNIAIFVIVLKNFEKNKDTYKNIANIFLYSGLCKFGLEFFRASWNYGISSTQIISIIFIILGIVLKIVKRKDK